MVFFRRKKMKPQNMLKLSIVALIGMVASQMAMAQGVNNPGSLPNSFATGTPANGWVVIDPSGTPIPVSLDPSGSQVWSKNFTGPNGGSFVYPAMSPPLPVSEVLQVAPNLPWTDWHEDVLDPSWVWVNPAVFVNNVQIFPTVTGVGTSNLSFFFTPALNVGDLVIIRKELQYNGVPGTAFIGTLPIHQYPTPEPASLGLLALGGLVTLRRRRRIVD
jgi:hypothetical protein